MTTFAEKYGATPFDDTDPRERLAEAARRFVLDAAFAALASEGHAGKVRDGADMPYLIGGLLVGVAQVAIAQTEGSEQDWAAVRASIVQCAGWSVDAARTFQNLPPLKEA